MYNLNYGIPELNGTQEERQDAVQVTVQDGTQNVHQGVHQERQVGTQSGTQRGIQDVHQDVHQGVHQGNDNNIEKTITLMIEKDNKVTLTKMANEVGVNEKTIRRCLKKMKNIKYVGSGYSGHWEIVKDK